MSSFVGIDPGTKGAVSLISLDGIESWELKKYDIKEVLLSLKARGDVKLVALEAQGGRAAEGRCSINTMMEGYGIIKGLLMAYEMPFLECWPQTWQKGLKLPKRAKQADHKKDIAKVAKGLFPTADLYGPRGGLLDGVSDSLVIGDYGRRHYYGMKSN